MNTDISIDHLLELQSLIDEIRDLKKQKDAVIVAHYYMSPELQLLENYGGIADFIGDSLGLSLEAKKVEHQNIVFCGVRFMAESAKIMSPQKGVFLPDHDAGCSLASSIRAEDVRELRRRYPGRPVVAYVNTYADVKAEADVCCTSRNAIRIIESFESEEVIFVPDRYMGQNLQSQLAKRGNKLLIMWDGVCEVHEQFEKTMLSAVCAKHPEAEVLLHWEVPQNTVNSTLDHENGILGSTNDIINYVKNSQAQSFILASECDLGATLKGLYPSRTFITPCIRCPHMKRITLENTLRALKSIGTQEQADFEIVLDEELMSRARRPIERMLEFA